MSDVDLMALVRSAQDGDAVQRAQLFQSMYAELHRLAQRELRVNGAATLSPTTLLHETFLNMAQRDSVPHEDRSRFMAYAARAMRGLLIDYLRNRLAQKRGGKFQITSLPTELPFAATEDIELDKLEAALQALATIDPHLAECVDLKFFCGFSHTDIANLWSVSERTVQRDWDKARILLHRLLNEQRRE